MLADLGREGARMVPVYDRMKLRPGNGFDGPAVLEQFDSTALIQAGQQVVVIATGGGAAPAKLQAFSLPR